MLSHFGKYTLLRKLATGGMAEIFLAQQTDTPQPHGYVVVKRILPWLNEDNEFKRMFLDEMCIATLLKHPNIVQILDVGSSEGQYYIAMEYLDGRDLRRIARKAAVRAGPVPLEFAIYAATHVCEGLDYAHHRRDHTGVKLNIVHRDVSPQNIMATVTGEIKLLDFGIAMAENRFNQTQTGVLKGRYAYMSPEQATGRPLDLRSDIFSVGATLYELTTHSRLFDNPNELALLQMVAQAQVERPSQRVHDYPPELERILLKALARRPSDRFASCRELKLALQEFAEVRRLVMPREEAGQLVGNLFAEDKEHENRRQTMVRGDAPVADYFLAPEEREEESEVTDLAPEFEVIPRPLSRPARTPAKAERGERASWRSRLLWLGSTLLLLVAGSAVWLVVGLDQPAAVPANSPHPLIGTEERPRYGRLVIQSQPPGAVVTVDGHLRLGRTPTTWHKAVIGQQYRLEARLRGQPAQARSVQLSGQRQETLLRFDFAGSAGGSSPPYPAEPTPAVSRAARKSSRTGGARSARQRRHSSSRGGKGSARTQPGARTRQQASASETAETAVLVVTTEPKTRVFAGKKLLGQTPVTATLPAGAHQLRLVNRPLLINYQARVRLRAGQRLAHHVTLRQGRLRVSARPYGEVRINGVGQGQTPLMRKLYVGTYAVEILNHELSRQERRTVKITPGADERIRIDWR